MTDYRCPTCTGGFPASALEDGSCPWCGQELGQVEQDQFPLAVSRATDGDEPAADSPLGRLFT